MGVAADQAAQLASDQDEIGPGEEGTHVLAVGTSLEAEGRMACQETLGQAETLAVHNADGVAAHSSKGMEIVAGIEDVEVGVAAAAELVAGVVAAVVAEMVPESAPESAPEASKQESVVWHSTCTWPSAGCRASARGKFENLSL